MGADSIDSGRLGPRAANCYKIAVVMVSLKWHVYVYVYCERDMRPCVLVVVRSYSRVSVYATCGGVALRACIHIRVFTLVKELLKLLKLLIPLVASVSC